MKNESKNDRQVMSEQLEALKELTHVFEKRVKETGDIREILKGLSVQLELIKERIDYQTGGISMRNLESRLINIEKRMKMLEEKSV